MQHIYRIVAPANDNNIPPGYSISGPDGELRGGKIIIKLYKKTKM